MDNSDDFSISEMCCFMKVSRSGYYEWLNRPESNRGLENRNLTNMIKQVFNEGRGIYGARRIVAKLTQAGINSSRKRVSKLMKKAKLICKTKRKFKITTNSKHHKPMLVNDAMKMAIQLRKPSSGLIWHTDRGSQYASDSHRKILQENGIIQSMSRKGDCWDNAVAESFFHTLKTELVNHYKFRNQQEAKNVIFEYIQVFYNQTRAHSAIYYLAPAQFELKMLAA